MILKRLQPAISFILAFAIITAVFGQMRPNPSSQRSSSSSLSVDSFDFSLPQTTAQPQPQMILPVDNSIDENTYLIGGGDVFFVTATGSSFIRYTAAVDQTGKAFVQNAGVIDIGKVSYADAKKRIAEYISSTLKNPSEIYVALVQTKSATVYFTGEIHSPGSHILPGTTRLLDAIRIANNGELPSPSQANLRQVQCTNGDSVVFYDLMAYLYKGDASQNPYIYPGDRIHVHTTTDRVFVGGAVKSPPPGPYPLKKGETISEFLSMFTLDTKADTDNIIIHQSSENTVKSVSLSTTDYVLNDFDAITVPTQKNQRGLHNIYVIGEVVSPGSYPIVENVTSARQLIDRAGGTTENANMEQAVVIRSSKNLPAGFNAEASKHVGAVRPERGTSVAMASTTTDHTIIRLINYNADKIILEPGDRIFIPKKDRFVYISGSVRSPGVYPFVRGKDVSYYIAQAGGYSKNADKTNIQAYLKYDNAVQAIEPRCIEPGSVIVVPASVQYKFLSTVALPLVSATATTIGVIISIYTLRRN